MPYHLTLSQALPLNHYQATSGQMFPFAGCGFLICKNGDPNGHLPILPCHDFLWSFYLCLQQTILGTG